MSEPELGDPHLESIHSCNVVYEPVLVIVPSTQPLGVQSQP